MFLQNPSYFYEILPYTYALGISKKWIKQFKNIDVQPLTCYSLPNSNALGKNTLATLMENTMMNAERVMTSIPSHRGNDFTNTHY